jgi:hypothetical protein
MSRRVSSSKMAESEAEEAEVEVEHEAGDAGEAQDQDFESLQVLLNLGINASDLKKLEEFHIHTVEALKMTPKRVKTRK